MSELSKIIKAIDPPMNGLVTGPTGSGKNNIICSSSTFE